MVLVISRFGQKIHFTLTTGGARKWKMPNGLLLVRFVVFLLGSSFRLLGVIYQNMDDGQRVCP